MLFASDAGGVGLNLQRAANACINLELPWNPAVLEQRIGRIYRLGQSRPIDVYNLVSEQGIESRIAELVGSKQAFFKGLFDGTTDAVVFERSGSFLSRIERIVVPAISPAPARAEDVSVAEDDGAEREIEAVVAAGDESRDVALAAMRPSRRIRRRHPASCRRRDRAAYRQRRTGHRGAAGSRVDVGSALLRDGAAAPGRRDTAGHSKKVPLGAFDHTRSAARPIARRTVVPLRQGYRSWIRLGTAASGSRWTLKAGTRVRPPLYQAASGR